ncbi:glycerate kinase [Candidatus Woesearchaeota archaeon]|nr:glycerate kinase [Candidatus Woesearchaeota archaeon]
MKILIAPDSFKGTFSARQIASFMAKGAKKAYPHSQIKIMPMADGGEGTIEAVVFDLKGKIITKKVTGPLGYKVKAKYAFVYDKNHHQHLAFIEMAEAAGLTLVHESKRNPLYTTTYGVGELMLDAIKRGAKEIIIGIGGSATNDAGCGMAQALGVEFLDKNGERVNNNAFMCGKLLSDLKIIDVSNVNPKFKKIKFLAACDVSNPLYGRHGAAHMYAHQKGATKDDVKLLDKGLRNIAVVYRKSKNSMNYKKSDKQKKSRHDIALLAGSGSAGGLGFGLRAFCNAKLESGIEIISEILDLKDVIKKSDLIITGEGRLDKQSIHNKAPVGIAKIANKYKKKVIAVPGSVGNGYEKTYKYFDVIVPAAAGKYTHKELIQYTPKLVEEAVVKALVKLTDKNKSGK